MNDAEHSSRSNNGQVSWARSLWLRIREILIIVIGAIVVSAGLRAFVFEPFTIPSGSMEQTFQINDKVMAQKVVDFHRGDVIVFADPGGWLGEPVNQSTGWRRGLELVGVLPDTSRNYLTKRVIGMPGDTVSCCDQQGRVSVNGHPLDENGYLYSDGGQPVAPSEIPFTVTVPAGRVFVMGDHRNASADSRCHLEDVTPGQPEGMSAFVPVENVTGSVVLIIAPFERWRELTTPATFDAVPPPEAPAPRDPQIRVEGGC